MKNRGYYIRAKRIRELTIKHYEPERHDKCLKQVWRFHIHPLFGISYRTYLRYLRADIPKEYRAPKLPKRVD